MTATEIRQWNRMLDALRTIAKQYSTPETLRKRAEIQYGLSYGEILEMAYENIQGEAKVACHKIKYK